jgi:DnaJ-class molecular chaperone
MNSNGTHRLTRAPQPLSPGICPKCAGDGRRECSTPFGTHVHVCPVCDGTGRVDARTAVEHRQPDRRLARS